MLNKLQAIDKMNRMGRHRRPFLFVVSFDQNANLVLEPPDIQNAGVLYMIGQYTNVDRNEAPDLPEKIEFKATPVSFKIYKNAFEKVQEHLHHGNTYLTNMTFPAHVETNLTFEQIFYHAQAPYKILLPGKVVVFSPEKFVITETDHIRSFPMKGTIDARIPDAHNKVLNDPKETAEHHTIVDLIRNDLNLVARQVYVRSFRYIDHLKTNQKELLQVSSEVVGQIGPEFYDHLGTNLFELLPAGSISGAPKKKTLDIIKDVEPHERGLFTGVFGFFDGRTVESAVMIRYMEIKNRQVLYKSGGGITVASQVALEYQELIDKIYVPIV